MWIVSQFGAREHYAIARALDRKKMLDALCTDYWAGPLSRMAGQLPIGLARALAGRHHPDLVDARVVSWNAAVLGRQIANCRREEGAYRRFVADGHWFGGKVRDWLEGQNTKANSVFSYDTTALEPFKWAQRRGIRRILGQMDPGRVEADLVATERERWPDWEASPMAVPEEYHARRAEEWILADRIIVNSNWSRDCLIQQGVPEGKLAIVPLVYEVGSKSEVRGQGTEIRTNEGPLRVLFLGQVNLRKGIPYLMEAARLLDPEKVEFDVVGPIQISDQARAGAPRNLCFRGPVSRNDVASHYRRADVFVLPTLSDGFAITQLEAMAYGLPVITTDFCGEVVTDGKDGRVVPARDPGALAEAILALANDRDNLEAMSAVALGKSHQFTIDRLAACLNDI